MEKLEHRGNRLDNVFTLSNYLFLGIIVGNIGRIFMGIFDIQDNVIKILGIFVIWFILPGIGLIKISQGIKKVVSENDVLWFIVPNFLLLLNFVMAVFILICVAVDIQNTVIDPQNPINVFKRIDNTF